MSYLKLVSTHKYPESLMLSKENIKHHLREYFQGISQCLCFKNAYFGFSLTAISLFFSIHMFTSGLIASLIGYFYSTLYRTPKLLKQTGLMTINGFFLGLAFAFFFEKSIPFYFCLLVGSLATPLVTKASFEILQHWKLSPLIFPYIVTVWIMWLCSSHLDLPLAVNFAFIDRTFFGFLFPELSIPLQFLKSVLTNMGLIFFFKKADYGLCLLLLVTLFSPRRGVFFFVGTTLATLAFYIVAPPTILSEYQMYSYSAGLVGLSLAALPEQFSSRTILLFCIISLFVTLALDQLFIRFGLPILSLPYVLTFWFAVLSRAPRLNLGWAPTQVI